MKKNKIYYFSILLLIVFIGITLISISYSKFIYNGNLTGMTIIPSKKGDIEIIDVSFLEGNDVYQQYNIINEFVRTNIDSSIILRDSYNSTITYQITVTNNDEEVRYYVDSEFVETDNPEIIYEINGITKGDAVLPGESKTFTITFKHAEEKNGYDDNILHSIIKLNFSLTQIKNYEELVFTGTNYYDTGVYLFSAENIGKNFDISFDVINVGNNQSNLASVFNSMLEVAPYPGFVLRYSNGHYEFNSPGISTINVDLANANKILLKRYNDVYYIQINDGELTEIGVYEANTTFDVPLTIGASLDGNGNPWRYFVGTLANISVNLYEPEKYTVRFNANGGTGTMDNQVIRIDESKKLAENQFEKDGDMFLEWNTKADGTGDSYADKEIVNNIAGANQYITLYAIWKETINYTVHFDANGGTGSMDDQQFEYGTPDNLYLNTFTKNNRTFAKWNTEADGSGTDYEDGELVKKLTMEDNGVVTLYAMWAEDVYSNQSEVVFNGNNSINTGMYLFSTQNVNKNFEIYFEIVNRNSTGDLATIASAMDESGSPWPGIVYRIQSNTTDSLAANANNDDRVEKSYDRNTTSTVAIKRKNGILYMNINHTEDEMVLDMSNMISTFNVPLTFGCSLNGNGNPQRYFNGTLKNLKVILYE